MSTDTPLGSNNVPDQQVRKSESSKKHFRSERTVFINNRWYFQSRENAPEGPFTTREGAEEAVARYLKVMNSPMFEDKERASINNLSY